MKKYLQVFFGLLLEGPSDEVKEGNIFRILRASRSVSLFM
jgi:hypothetical protein